MAMGYDPDFQDVLAKRIDGFRGEGELAPPVALWSLVYVANLPFPAFMGFLLSHGPGLIGMAMGVALLYEAGRRACLGHPRAARTVSYGGVAVAVAQLFPIFHVLAGMVGVGVACHLFGRDFPGGSTLGPMGALIATVVTGTLLIAWASVIGLLIRAVISMVSWPRRGSGPRWAGPEKP